VQLTAAKADVSFASPLNLRAAIPKGPVTVRQIAGLYVYDNELYAVEATGKMVREALENAARYYNSCTGSSCSTGPLLSGAVYTFNFDTAAGVSYGIDLSKPVGERIVNLTWHGKPLRDDQILRVAINNYRAGGSGGYTMWPKAKLLWRSYDTVRDLMIRYYAAGHKIPAAPDDNWDIRPEQAHRELQKEIQKVVQGSGSQ
jgi:2',3'-cyclic-nucleotide 2'-phosphodiesterase/3'-nucleotidase